MPRRGQNCDCRRGREKGTVLRRRNRAPGAHAESQQMSTGRTRVRGVTTHSVRAATQGQNCDRCRGAEKGSSFAEERRSGRSLHRRRAATISTSGQESCDRCRGQRKGAVLRRREGVEGACIGDAPRLSRRVGRSPDVGGRVPEDGRSTDGILRSAQDDSIPVILRP